MNDLDDPGVEPKVFDGAAARNHERVVILRLDLIESGVQREIVAALLCIRLLTFEIVDAGRNELAGFFPRTDRVNRVSDHLQRLKRHHHFVVFDVIANQHENGCLRHEASAGGIVKEEPDCSKRSLDQRVTANWCASRLGDARLDGRLKSIRKRLNRLRLRWGQELCRLQMRRSHFEIYRKLLNLMVLWKSFPRTRGSGGLANYMQF